MAEDKSLDTKNYVNVLSWWGYLDDPRIAEAVKDQCGVNLSVDEYYTNEEFSEIFKKHQDRYDVIVFSNLMYKSIENKIADNNSTLSDVAKGYYPYFRDYYFQHNYPKNVVFFSHALMGFMYNPAVMQITPGEDIFDIFKSAKNNYVVVVDDPAEIRSLLTLGYKTSGQVWPKNTYDSEGMVELNYNNFKRVSQNTNIFTTNDYNQIYKLNNFAMSFMWSGDSILYIQQSHKPYKFILDPKLSYICTDLLAQIKNSQPASCVAHVLESPKVMAYVENSTYYFSPYFQDSVDDPRFHALYGQTAKMLPKLSWIEPVSDFPQYDQEWEALKIKLNEKDN